MSSPLRLLFLILGWTTAVCAAETVLRTEEVVVPSEGNVTGPSLATGPDGTVWMSWLEQRGGTSFLLYSTFDVAGQRWRTPRTIARGEDWFINSADFPTLAVGDDGNATAVWFVRLPPARGAGAAHDHAYRALIAQTKNGGDTWSEPTPLTRESDRVEFVSLAPLPDGRVLAAWLDGRAQAAGHGSAAQQVYARIIGDAAPDVRVDDRVCDCCQTTLRALADGTAVLAYRGRTADEVRDIRIAQFRDGRWSKPRPLHDDGWKIAGCPVNGPQLAVDGGRVAATWFTAASENPRVFVALSLDAGARFLAPLPISETKPAGRVATVILHDGAILASWVDADGSLWLRRITPNYEVTPATRLAHGAQGRIKGFPRLALLKDYAGGKSNAELLVAFTRENAAALTTLHVTVPEGELLEDGDCGCNPSVEQLQGWPFRGTLRAIAADGTLRVEHADIPGLLRAGQTEFRSSGDPVGIDAIGQTFLGRIERHRGEWRLWNFRPIASPPAP